MTGEHGLSLSVKPRMRLGRPLHRRAGAIAFGQIEIVAHPDLVAVADHRRARQRAHQAVGEFEPAPVAAEHRRQPAADAAVVKLHVLVGAERLEHSVALRLGQPAEIEFVMVAQEQAPLRGRPAAVWSPPAPWPAAG